MKTDQILQKMQTAQNLRWGDPELAEVFARSALEDAQALGCDVNAVEFPRQLDERRVAPRRDIGNDRAHRLFHIGRALALSSEKSGKPRVKIGGPSIEADRHRKPAALDWAFRSMACAMHRVNPRRAPRS